VIEAMENRELTCICCPLGCQIKVVLDGGEIKSITGNTCERGKVYAQKEVTNPTRIVTSTVKISGGEKEFTSVKTKNDIPKGKIFDVMKDINKVVAKAPINIGDVVIDNVAGTGVSVIATKAVGAK